MAPMVLARMPACPRLRRSRTPGGPSLDGSPHHSYISSRWQKKDSARRNGWVRNIQVEDTLSLTAGRDGSASPTVEAGVVHGSYDRCPRGSRDHPKGGGA